MADNRGVIFGDYFLNYELFEPIFIEWYSQKRDDFKNALETEVIAPIEQMIVIENNKVVSKHGAAVRKADYDAAKIYNAWERLSKEYFGNSPVTLLIGAKFNSNKYQWTNTINESDVINQKGIAVRKKALENLKDAADNIKSIYAAADVQDIINRHIDNMMQQLNGYELSTPEALAMHQLLEARRSVLNNASFHFTGATYNQIIFGSQQNAEGKQLDAFMNHMGNYHAEIFNLLSSKVVSGTNLMNSTVQDIEDDFPGIFANTDEVQPWLLDSLNSASWLTGGDIVVLNSKGSVIYNIQLKTTKRGKTFEVATSSLYKFATEMRNLMNEDAAPEELAKLMFERLATTAANQGPAIENFYTEEVYKDIEKNLNMRDGSVKLALKLKI